GLRAHKFPVPINKGPNSVFDTRPRTKPDVSDQVVDVGIGGWYIAGLQRQHPLFRLAAEAVLQRLDQMHKFDRIIIADIINSVRSVAGARIRLSTVPPGIRGCDAVTNSDHA